MSGVSLLQRAASLLYLFMYVCMYVHVCMSACELLSLLLFFFWGGDAQRPSASLLHVCM